MQPIRQVIPDAPESIPILREFRHRSIKLIIWALDEATEPKYEKTMVRKTSLALDLE